jgi:transcriptional regulator GlxA family with amidase domain
MFSYNNINSQVKGKSKSTDYMCPMECNNAHYSKPGSCTVCKMDLIKYTKKIEGKYAENKEMTVCFYLQDNVEILDFAGPLEVFTVAGFNVFIVSKTLNSIKTQGVLTIVPEFTIENAPPADVMVFFGGSHGEPTNDPEIISWIKSRVPSTDYFISVCTGAFIMGKAGVLDGLSATCYKSQIDNLQKALPRTKVLKGVRVVDNGNVISTAGISAGIDGALHFIGKIKGNEYSQYVADIIEYDNYKQGYGLYFAKNDIAKK